MAKHGLGEEETLYLQDCKFDTDKIKAERESLVRTQTELMESITIKKSSNIEDDDLESLADME